MEIGYLWIFLVFLALISLMILYFKNRVWEDLLENKQKEFNIKGQVKRKSSAVYQKAVTFASITMFVSVLGANNMGLFNFGSNDSSDRALKTYGTESDQNREMMLESFACDNINEQWANNDQKTDNRFLMDYDLKEIVESNEQFEYMESFQIVLCDIPTQVDIYQLDEEYYAYLDVVDQFYLLTLKK
jgi:hypothetical protein